jgi:predicted nucleotidyltransferase
MSVPAIPQEPRASDEAWLVPTPFRLGNLGPGLSSELLEPRLRHLAQDPEVQALVLFGSRARGEARPESDLDLLVVQRHRLDSTTRLDAWRRARHALGSLPVDLDLVIEDVATAEHLKTSRWHVLGHAFRQGRVLHAAG